MLASGPVAARLTTDDVRHVAALARLELTADEIDTFAAQLAAILDYAAEVERIDTTAVPPLSHPHAVEAWRDDDVRPGLERDEVLRRAPDANLDAGLFRVPKVL